MQSDIERKMMVCPLNGEICANGIRKDFPEDQATGQKLSCRWWVHVVGKEPQSEKPVDHFDCTMAWMPVLQIEGAQMTRMVTAAVDKTATEVRRQHVTFLGALPDEARDRLMQSQPAQLIEHGR